MRVSLGIFAHNEEARIGATLASLRSQDLFAPASAGGWTLDVVVMPNGCRDRTADVASAALASAFHDCPHARVRVEVLPEPGKSRTWNTFVHRLSDPAADLLVCMDGDIDFVGSETLRRLVEALRDHPEAHASVDCILKDLALRKEVGLRGRLSLAASELALAGPPKLAGSLYAVRAAVARRIWMPVGLLVEDGYLKAMLCTDNFTAPDTPARLVRAEGAAHTFEAVTDFRTLLKHETRLLVGSAMNILLFEHLEQCVRKEPGRDGGTLVGEWNRTAPDWFPALVDRGLKAKGWWLAPTGFLLLPLRQLRTLGGRRAIRRLPAALARVAFNALAALSANRQLRQRRFQW